ncbi:hypothetical protein EV183_000302 [Coemansia sp. RSA 2336]|nr:hypothetical protein EV183_000302 [Coemansia sp. RSA 2336]
MYIEQMDAGDNDESGSDISGNQDSDEGFDGQCDNLSLTATSETTAECSRSQSYSSGKSNSSNSSSSSSSSTSSESVLTWWKRHFKARPKTQPPVADFTNSLLRRSTVSAHASRPRPASTAGNNPILTKLKRSVSSKSSTRLIPMPSTKQTHAAADTAPQQQQPKLARASLISGSLLSRAKSTKANGIVPIHAPETPEQLDSGKETRNKVDVPAQTPTNSIPEDTFVSRWTMLKCKGMENLHVVSVPARCESLNHKDAFLFYPCVFHSLDTAHHAAENAAGTSAADAASADYALAAKGTSDTRRVHSGTLLSQEYNRRKSVYSLASRTIYVWLGAHASAIKRDAITRVAMEIRDKELMNKAAIVVVDESAASNGARKQFFAQLHRAETGSGHILAAELSAMSSRITPLDRAGDDMDFEKALQRRKVVYGFWEAVPPATIIAADTYVNAAALQKVPAGGAIVLDTWSDVFIWWRNEPCNPAVRRCAVNFANMLVKDTSIPPRPQSASVWHEVQGFEHVIFKTKFPDWPFVFASSMGTSEVVRQMVSDSAPPPLALPVRSISRHSRPVAVV